MTKCYSRGVSSRARASGYPFALPSYLVFGSLRLHIRFLIRQDRSIHFAEDIYFRTLLCGEKTIKVDVEQRLVYVWSSSTNCRFSSSLCHHCPTTAVDLRSRDRGNPQSTLFVPDKAEEVTVTHSLGCERLPALSCGVPSNPLEIRLFARWQTTESFICFLHTS